MGKGFKNVIASERASVPFGSQDSVYTLLNSSGACSRVWSGLLYLKLRRELAKKKKQRNQTIPFNVDGTYR